MTACKPLTILLTVSCGAFSARGAASVWLQPLRSMWYSSAAASWLRIFRSLRSALRFPTSILTSLLLARISIVLERGYLLQHRIDPGIENVHDFMRMKRTMAALLPLGPQDIELHEYGNRRIRRRKGDLQTLDQSTHRHYWLTEQQVGDAPGYGVLASPTPRKRSCHRSEIFPSSRSRCTVWRHEATVHSRNNSIHRVH